MENSNTGLDCYLSDNNDFVCGVWRRIRTNYAAAITDIRHNIDYCSTDGILYYAFPPATVYRLAKKMIFNKREN